MTLLTSFRGTAGSRPPPTRFLTLPLGLQQLLLPPVSPEDRLRAGVDPFRRAARDIVLGVVECRAEVPGLAPDQLPVLQSRPAVTPEPAVVPVVGPVPLLAGSVCRPKISGGERRQVLPR